MGVGSSIIAAAKNKRIGYGCDTLQKYVDIAWERVSALKAGTLRTRPMNKPIYDPTKPKGGHTADSVDKTAAQILPFKRGNY
jgi:adenine-specific DNA-methyltransferase